MLCPSENKILLRLWRGAILCALQKGRDCPHEGPVVHEERVSFAICNNSDWQFTFLSFQRGCKAWCVGHQHRCASVHKLLVPPSFFCWRLGVYACLLSSQVVQIPAYHSVNVCSLLSDFFRNLHFALTAEAPQLLLGSGHAWPPKAARATSLGRRVLSSQRGGLIFSSYLGCCVRGA